MPENLTLDLSEKGKTADGQPDSLDRRLFMQFLAFGQCPQPAALIEPLQQAGFTAALYADINDPYGVGLLVAAEQAELAEKKRRRSPRR